MIRYIFQWSHGTYRPTGRPRYDREKLLKMVLFALMEFGCCSVRQIKKLCETDIHFIWMLDEEKAPSHMTISSFIKNELRSSLDEIFNDINQYMFGELFMDLNYAQFPDHILVDCPELIL